MFLYFLGGAAVGLIFSVFWVQVVLKIVDFERPFPESSLFRKYHIHYSFIGLVLLIISPLVIKQPNLFAFILGLAIAIIIKHTTEDDGFVFITKNK